MMTVTKPIYILVPYLKKPDIDGFRHLVEEALPDFDTNLIGFLECPIADVLNIAEQLVSQDCKIILSTDATARFLQEKLEIEVYPIRTGAFDVIQALADLPQSYKIALLNNTDSFDLNQYRHLFSVDLVQFNYDSYLSAKNQINLIQFFHQFGFRRIVFFHCCQ